MPPPPSRRFAQRPRTGRTTATPPRPGTGRQQGRGRTSTALRGTGRKARVRADNPLLGILSSACFVLFWVFLFVAAFGAVDAVKHEDEGLLRTSAGVMLAGFIMPIIGLSLGIAGLVHRRAQRVAAWIGVALNGCLLLFFLVTSLAGRHS